MKERQLLIIILIVGVLGLAATIYTAGDGVISEGERLAIVGFVTGAGLVYAALGWKGKGD